MFVMMLEKHGLRGQLPELATMTVVQGKGGGSTIGQVYRETLGGGGHYGDEW